MKSALEQSIKEKIKALAKERETTFAELWRNLILERFLTRLARSPHKEKFVLKGGILGGGHSKGCQILFVTNAPALTFGVAPLRRFNKS